ncbi:YceD family protein [Bacillaceae bacterium IKA-2]|jgi:uncharacterized protein|nr:YceD family protein [Bacillaceae bacterium IKA-2]
MKWSIQQLNMLKNKGINIDEMVDVSEIMKVDHEIKDVSLVHVKGTASFTSHSVTFFLQLEGEMVLTCARTLADVPFPIQIATTETFKLHDWVGFVEGDEIHDLDNGTVNLIPYIVQALLLEIPLQIFSEEQFGDALPKGENWELITSETKKERIDPRLAELSKFFDDK